MIKVVDKVTFSLPKAECYPHDEKALIGFMKNNNFRLFIIFDQDSRIEFKLIEERLRNIASESPYDDIAGKAIPYNRRLAFMNNDLSQEYIITDFSNSKDTELSFFKAIKNDINVNICCTDNSQPEMSLIGAWECFGQFRGDGLSVFNYSERNGFESKTWREITEIEITQDIIIEQKKLQMLNASLLSTRYEIYRFNDDYFLSTRPGFFRLEQSNILESANKAIRLFDGNFAGVDYERALLREKALSLYEIT